MSKAPHRKKLILSYEDAKNNRPLETYINIMSDIFLDHNEYVLFSIIVANTGLLAHNDSRPMALHSSDVVSKIISQNSFEPCCIPYVPPPEYKTSETYRDFRSLLGLGFIERENAENASEGVGIQTNTKFFFSIKAFLYRTYYSLGKFREEWVARLARTTSLKNAIYECESCTRVYYNKLDEHLLVEKIHMTKRCPICNGAVSNLSNLAREQRADPRQILEMQIEVIDELLDSGRSLIELHEAYPEILHNQLESIRGSYTERLETASTTGRAAEYQTSDNDSSGQDQDIDRESVYEGRRGHFFKSKKTSHIVMHENTKPVWFQRLEQMAQDVLGRNSK